MTPDLQSSAYWEGTRFASPFLDSVSQQIRGKTIPWESYVNAGLIAREDLTLLLDFERARGSNGKLSTEYVTEFGQGLVQTLLSILPNVKNNEVVQFILVTLDDLLPDYEGYFWLGQVDPLHVLVHFIDVKSEEFVTCKAARIFTTLVACRESLTARANDVEKWSNYFVSVCQWISQALLRKEQQQSQQQEKVQLLASQYLQSLLSVSPRFKETLFEKSHEESVLNPLLGSLADSLRQSAIEAQKTQLAYQILYIWWILSFNGPQVASKMSLPEYGVTSTISDMAKSAVKEKVVRMSVAIFRNLLEKSAAENTSALIGCKLLPFMEVLSARKYVDEEIIADIKFIKDQLTQAFQNLSSFDEYASEVRSGQLDWSPPHQSELFWRDNVTKFHDRDMEMLKLLSRIVSSSDNAKILAIACHDLGQYVKYNPQGKKYLQELGAKQAIMHLMSHENADVRYNALSAVQKYMMNVWNQ